jgi:hypothetical protein
MASYLGAVPISKSYLGQSQVSSLQTGGGGVLVSSPAAFGWADYPLEIRRQGSLLSSVFTFTSPYDATRPVPDLTIYAGAGGSDANDGLTYATRKRSLNAATLAAQAAPTVGCVRAAGGIYALSAGNALNVPAITKPTIIESYDGLPVISLRDVAMPAWVRHGATNYYKSAYTSELPGVFAVDFTNLDADGDPQPLAPLIAAPANPLDPTTELDARFAAFPTLGCSYKDTTNKVFWARTFDGRAPDASIVVTDTAAGHIYVFTATQRKLWIQDLKPIGGNNGIYVGGADSANGQHQAYLKRVTVVASNGVGLQAETAPGRMISEYCKTKNIMNDGFSYTNGTHAELGCVSDWCCWDGASTSNATTEHGTAKLISVNGLYKRAGRVIAHVGDTRHWILGSSFGQSRLTSGSFGTSTPLYLGGSTHTTKMWADCCTILLGSLNGPFVASPAEFRYSALTGPVPTGGGVVEEYTP